MAHMEQNQNRPAPAGLAHWATTRELMVHTRIRDKRTISKLIAAGMPVHRIPGMQNLMFDLLEVDEWLRREGNSCSHTLPGQRDEVA